MSNEPNTLAEDEPAVEGRDPDVLVSLFGCEGARVAEEVDEADSNATDDVQDELERGRSANEVEESRLNDNLQYRSWQW